VAPADLVMLHRVVCCYPDYERLLGAAADHARRALVFSYPPRNALSRAFYSVFNLVMRLTQAAFAALPTRRARCWRCWSITDFGRPSSAAAASGRSLAWNAFRKGGARCTIGNLPQCAGSLGLQARCPTTRHRTSSTPNQIVCSAGHSGGHSTAHN
jgi:hypothetical protein